MKSKKAVFISIILIFLFGCMTNEQYETGKSYHGFKLVDKRFVKEVKAPCLYFIHEKTGARLFKIMNDDTNKTFSIAFKTVPDNDCGTPHIIEHSVLNGSKHFPVKSPFDQLLKGSLNTFLNAMTASDVTIYPVASMNEKDYFNLMHVYLDAVFYPNIYSDPRIFMQEGWHHELENAKSDVEYKGVVYNEMKGSFSSPTRELGYQKMKLLFPDNSYGFSSGGYPSAIPQLTYESFLNFHRKHYHPSNSYILLYGDADLNRELEFINESYLKDFEKSTDTIEIPLQKPFEAMKTETRPYPISDSEPLEHSTYLSLSFVAGKNTDFVLTNGLSILTEALVNHESAPIRLALQEAGIGKDVSANLDDIQQNVFEIRVQNADEADKQKFYDIIMTTLKKVADEGLDKKMLDGIINRIEFLLREGDDAQKGIMYNWMNVSGWIFANDPYAGLEYEKQLGSLKVGMNNGLLKQLITEQFINNPHSLLLALVPERGLQSTINNETAKELNTYKSTLTNSEIDSLVKTTADLIDHQKLEDTPEALATIPVLELSDISTTGDFYQATTKQIDSIKTIHFPTFTNGIIYSSLIFDLRVINEEDLPYARLLTEVLGKLPTQKYSFGELDKELSTITGGFNVRLSGYLKDQNEDNLQPKLEIGSKALVAKGSAMFDLITQIATQSKFDDENRLADLIKRHHSRFEQQMKQNGMGVAYTRMASYYSDNGMYMEKRGGIDYYRFLSDLVANYDSRKKELAQKLSELSKTIICKNNIILGVTCDEADYPTYTQSIDSLIKSLPTETAVINDWQFDKQQKNEGIETTSKVQYVLMGANIKKLGYSWNGNIKVLNQLLSTDYLQTQIRVIGGAYGGFCRFSPSGNAYFASSRDPNLSETIKNFKATPTYLDSLKIDQKELTRYIIGTIANIDNPVTPSDKGDIAISNYFNGITNEMIQKERAEILSTKVDSLKNYSKMISDIINQNNLCVYGNEEKIDQNKSEFKQTIKLAD